MALIDNLSNSKTISNGFNHFRNDENVGVAALNDKQRAKLRATLELSLAHPNGALYENKEKSNRYNIILPFR